MAAEYRLLQTVLSDAYTTKPVSLMAHHADDMLYLRLSLLMWKIWRQMQHQKTSCSAMSVAKRGRCFLYPAYMTTLWLASVALNI